MEGIYRIGNKNILIRSVCPNVHKMCRDYAAEGEADFSVETTQADIDYELERSDEKDKRDGIIRTGKRPGYLEKLAVYRKIARHMLDYDTFLFHGSAVCVGGEAYIFTALSGTGKSTHAALWRELLGDRAVMINDDKPLISVGEDDVTVYGTPWDGKHHLSSNTSVPLKAICILERGEQNIIERISVDEAYPMFLQQTYKPTSSIELMNTLDILDRLMNKVNIYRLKCNMEKEAAIVAYNGMKGD